MDDPKAAALESLPLAWMIASPQAHRRGYLGILDSSAKTFGLSLAVVFTIFSNLVYLLLIFVL